MAIRKAYIMTIPIVLMGVFSLVIVNFPNDRYQKWIQTFASGNIVNIFNVCTKASIGFLSLWLVIAISFSYISLCGEKIDNIFALPFIAVVAYLCIINASRENFSTEELSSDGMFVALFSAIISCELYLAILKVKAIRKLMNMNGMDTILVGAIRSIIPATIIILLSLLFRQVIVLCYGEASIQEIIEEIVSGMFDSSSTNYFTTLGHLIAIHFLWLFGLHGNNVLAAVSDKLFTANTLENLDLVKKGLAGKNIITGPTINCFVYMGGTGVVLCLAISTLMFIKRKSIRSVCKVGIIPAVFNVSEVITFGLPIVLNPILAVPFVLVPLINFTVTYLAMYADLVPKVVKNVYWTTPVLISGYEATGSIRGTMLQVLLMAIGIAVYYPFLKLSANSVDRKFIDGVNELKAELISFESVHQVSDFLERNDKIGDVARILAGDLKYDMEHNKLFMAYQPQVNSDGEYIGAEALLRWYHPVVGFVYPPLIIALAKEGKILNKLEKLIIDEVCKSVKYLQDHYEEGYKISANITAESLRYKEFLSMVNEEAEAKKIDKSKLWFEITEQEAVMSNDDLIEKLKRLKDNGHKLMIDDFGMGHTSILYLQSNIFDFVKLDGSITRNVLTNDRNADIITSIVNLSKTLDFQIISEYVETEEQKEKLRKLGVHIYQGYLYSKPIRFTEFITKLEENRAEHGKSKNDDYTYKKVSKEYINDKKNEVKDEVKEEVKDEVKEEQKEEIKEEVKEEPKEEQKEEIKEEVKEEPKEEAKEEVKEEVKEEAEDEVKEEVKEEPKEDVKEEVKEEAEDEVKEDK